ncbi:glycosyl hydrolase family 28-related protein [Mycolicibacterium austroafricanum]|uniref:glycosyl hydrolase family 28-related protein n=1 Tax=Mycolicibacterium austroafricanum TaxID=39687 RepID=UPI001ABFEA68|nr:glycosyl hydrolase family 28-related protein [Mycolicibacterium austroafricanum]QRZ05878.1 hypothetical protein JN090_23610 [Mycolicibacterium austroafricanum]
MKDSTGRRLDDFEVQSRWRRSIKDFGVIGDGTTDDTSAIVEALGSGYPLFAPEGTYLHDGIPLQNGTDLHGAGIAKTFFKLKANSSNAAMYTVNNYVGNLNLSGFTIDGNKANQSVARIGLDINNTGTATEHRSVSPFGNSGHDPRHNITNVMIWRCKGSGFRQQGRGASHFQRMWSMECDGHGFEILGYDNLYTHLDSGAAGLAGIYLSSSAASNRFSSIKSWYSGQTDRTTYGQGILLDGARTNQFSSTEIQNSGSDGIKLLNANGNMFASTVIEFPPNPANACDGVVVEDSSYTIGDFTVWDRGSSPYSLRHGIVLRKGSGSGCSANDIRATVQNQTGSLVSNQGGQTFANNRIDIAGGRYTYQVRANWGYFPAYANDAGAAAGGVSVGDTYFNTTVGAYTRRVS